MNLRPSRLPLLIPIFFALAAAAEAGTLSGTVINRTTGKPEPNIVLDLLSPTQNMTELATVTSDAQGKFSVTKDTIGGAPILIRATFHDVSFNTFAPPGRPNIEVEIYDISKDAKIISVPSHVIIFEPQGGKLLGAEEYTVQNPSKPPVAYFRTDGNFDFAIPGNAALNQVSTIAEMGMSVQQASIDKGKGKYAIAFAFRPGQTSVRLSYDLPYSNNTASVRLPATYAGSKLLIVAPPGVTITGDGVTAAGQEQGMMVYTHDPLPAKGVASVSLSGVSTAPAGGDQSQGQEGNSRQDQGPQVIAAPSRLDDFKWYVFAGLAALFAMGALLLSRKQVIVTPGPNDEEVAPVVKPAKAKKAAPSPTPAAPRANPVPAAPAASAANHAAQQVDQHVAVTMESLKEQIFRLELRRQAGTISEQDYAREKAKFDQILRDMVQG